MTIIRPSDEVLDMPYWRHLAGGMLHLNICSDCGTARHPPGPICPKCRSFKQAWKAASGKATLHSYTVVQHAVHDLLTTAVPYTVTLVDLEEGVRLVSGIPPGRVAVLRVGMPLRCEVIKYDDKFALPYFLPLDEQRRLPEDGH